MLDNLSPNFQACILLILIILQKLQSTFRRHLRRHKALNLSNRLIVHSDRVLNGSITRAEHYTEKTNLSFRYDGKT